MIVEMQAGTPRGWKAKSARKRGDGSVRRAEVQVSGSIAKRGSGAFAALLALGCESV